MAIKKKTETQIADADTLVSHVINGFIVRRLALLSLPGKMKSFRLRDPIKAPNPC